LAALDGCLVYVPLLEGPYWLFTSQSKVAHYRASVIVLACCWSGTWLSILQRGNDFWRFFFWLSLGGVVGVKKPQLRLVAPSKIIAWENRKHLLQEKEALEDYLETLHGFRSSTVQAHTTAYVAVADAKTDQGQLFYSSVLQLGKLSDEAQDRVDMDFEDRVLTVSLTEWGT